MNREEKKEYLKQYVMLKRKVESLREECFFWSIPATKLEASGIKGSGRKNTLERHFEMLDKLNRLEHEACEKMDEIMAAIETVENEDYKSVLIYRYINDKYFYQIAPLMNRSLDNIFYLHRKALDAVKVNSHLQ